MKGYDIFITYAVSFGVISLLVIGAIILLIYFIRKNKK